MTRTRFCRAASTGALAILCACRSVPRRQCFPADGREVWIERHLRMQPSPDGQSIVEVRFAPDTSSQRHGMYQQATLLVSSSGAANTNGALRGTMTAKTPAVIRLVPRSYRFTVLALAYQHVSHTVDVVADDSVVIDVRLPGAAYCEETVTIDETR